MTHHDPRHDPETYGQKWVDIHSLTAHVDDVNEIPHTLKAIRVIIESIRCETCYQHANSYLKENQTDSYHQMKDEDGRCVGLFKYFHEFHNNVNIRLGKPYMNYETAQKMYYEPTNTCDDFCGV